MEFFQPTLPLSSLLCQESECSLECVEWEENENVLEEDHEEYAQILFNREINGNGVLQKQEFANALSCEWIKEARVDAIQYIFRTGLTFGFNVQTAYLAVTYMDMFLSRKVIQAEKHWIVPLLAISCLSLAAKMEECRVPLMSRLQEKNYCFESKVIQRMELLVLDTLEWRMKVITPFGFINYFMTKFCKNASSVVSKVTEVILKAIKGEMTIQHRPSTVAAAATLLTLDQTFSRVSLEQKINTLSCSNCLSIEEIFCSYNQLQEQEAKSFKFANSTLSPPLTPFQLLSVEGLEKATKPPHAVGSKRKSLTFGEVDQYIETDDNKRQC